MQITQTTVRGAGTLHDALARSGSLVRIFVKRGGGRELSVYPTPDSADRVTFELDEDEADLVADLLHSKPIPDRIAELERQMSELAGP